MDFITGLPKSKGKTSIMVVVDRLTNYAHFCAFSHPFKASKINLNKPRRKPKKPLAVHMVGQLANLMLGKIFTAQYSDPGIPVVDIQINHTSISNT